MHKFTIVSIIYYKEFSASTWSIFFIAFKNDELFFEQDLADDCAIRLTTASNMLLVKINLSFFFFFFCKPWNRSELQHGIWNLWNCNAGTSVFKSKAIFMSSNLLFRLTFVVNDFFFFLYIFFAPKAAKYVQ